MPVKVKRERKHYTYEDFVTAVEMGTRSGVRKYLKYSADTVLETEEQLEALTQQIVNYIMLDLGELIDWRGE